MKSLTVVLLAVAAPFVAAQNRPNVRQSLPFTSVVTGPWFYSASPSQSLSGTKVYARGGKLHLSNRTTADVSPSCRTCVRDTVIFVDGQTSNAYLDSASPQDNQLYIDPITFVLSYTTKSKGLPRGAITNNFIRVGDNPRGQTVSPASCDGCGLNQAPAMWGWPEQSYINSFYACPDDAPRTTSWTLYQRILYYSATVPENNCTYVQLAALNWRGSNPAVTRYN
ncbi:hypothetical protein NA57DRAFT_73253 [Rhizodiscina lignyota]|uniref:Uncharacterized protein n=1 Tax=Rhizodiscina lignyota TaxID=1504668 RepID=A0A9P4IM59_9PEZI|nr:hypothetical protein NA57DRAFT_73253 [Rhizodiscina lignyota]